MHCEPGAEYNSVLEPETVCTELEEEFSAGHLGWSEMTKPLHLAPLRFASAPIQLIVPSEVVQTRRRPGSWIRVFCQFSIWDDWAGLSRLSVQGFLLMRTWLLRQIHDILSLILLSSEIDPKRDRQSFKAKVR